MRQLAAAIVLLLVSGPSAVGQAPYSLRWGDAVSVVAAGVAAFIPEAAKLPKAAPSCAPCDPRSLPGIDRSALRTFSGSAGNASTALLVGVIGFAGVASLDGTTAAQRRGHVAVFANSVAFAAATSYLVMAQREHLPHRGRNAVLLYAGALGASALRVSAGKHFPTDVLGGAVLGTAIGWLAAKVHPTAP